MADALYELLSPHLVNSPQTPRPVLKDSTTTAYLHRLTTLPLSALTTSEPQALALSTQSLLLALQALSNRSHGAALTSATHLSFLRTTIPAVASSTAALKEQIPLLDAAALHFSQTYNKSSTNTNALLDRRRKALLLSRNAERLQDVLDLPTLLSSAISSSVATASGPVSSTAVSRDATLSYASALDLNAHIKRLQLLYPESALVAGVTRQAEAAMQDMCSNLIRSLQAPGIKLAAAMRTISWLRRVAPELEGPALIRQDFSAASSLTSSGSREGSLGLLFLTCRLSNLRTMLAALEPLRVLADQETKRRTMQTRGTDAVSAWSGGQQTERYLKRHIEIFREQSFAIISMFRSIFPAESEGASGASREDPLQPLPSALASFPMYLVDMLLEILKQYMPNVRDKSSRDSLLTQVLYCAGSLGRLGGDFSMILAMLHDEEEEEEHAKEWVEVIKKHRVLAGRLEVMVGNRDA